MDTDEAALKNREESRKQYLRKRFQRRVGHLEEELEIARHTGDIESEEEEKVQEILKLVKDESGEREDDDFEAQQLKKLQIKIKKFKSGGLGSHRESGESQQLPIAQHEQALMQLVRDNQVVIVVAETGSGKTTQLPQMLYKNGFLSSAPGMRLACTQPRRVAAMSVANRVSFEMAKRSFRDLRDGPVGYSVRFDDRTSATTVIKFLTDGMLLREFVKQPDMADYGVVMVDEAHERTISTDILLGLLKDLCRFRADLKLIISSATMDAEKLSTFFGDAPVYNAPGRLHHVERRFLMSAQPDYVYAAIQCCVDIIKRIVGEETAPGDILLFLTGQDEIELANRVLREKLREMDEELLAAVLIHPLYSALPSSLQGVVFKPTPFNCIKIVLATNIAETSITVDGIVHVVDCGMVKQRAFNPRTGIDSLTVTATSKASAEQRAGRAGRTRPGICYRLYTKASYAEEMPVETVPELQRSNLASVCLFMKALGIDEIVQFDFVDVPPPDLLARSLADLYRLGALEGKEGGLTRVGLQMSEYPVDPPLSRTIIEAVQSGCVDPVIVIVAMISTEINLFLQVPKDSKDKKKHKDEKQKLFSSPSGDHFRLLAIFQKWLESGKSEKWATDCQLNQAALNQADKIRRQLSQITLRLFPEMEDGHRQVGDEQASIQSAFLAGFSNNVATVERSGCEYTIAGGRIAAIHPSSCLADGKPPRRVLFHDIVTTSRDFMRTVMRIT